MRIGVVGDTHNRLPNVERIVDLLRDAAVERVVHTGDFTEPAVLARLARLEVPLVGVFGNNDTASRDPLEQEAVWPHMYTALTGGEPQTLVSGLMMIAGGVLVLAVHMLSRRLDAGEKS